MDLKKINFFNKTLEMFLQALPFWASVLLFIILKSIISKLNINFDNFELSNDGKFSFFIDIGIFVLSISPIFFKRIKNIFKNLKIFCYKCLLNYYHKTGNILIASSINKLINIFFKYHRIELQYQNDTAQIMMDLLKDDTKSSKIVFIVGEAYSGKTTSILLFLEQLIINSKNRKLFNKIEKNIYYCDCDASANTAKLFEEYNLNKYDKSLLIIDNIHRESESSFIQLLEQIITASNRAFAVFAIMRKPEEFINNVHSIDSIYKLLSETNKIELSQNNMSVSNRHIFNLEIDQNEYLAFCKMLYFNETDFEKCSILYIHVYKMFCIYKKYKHKFIMALFESLYNHTIGKKELEIVLGIILLSQFTGTFDIKDLLNVCGDVPLKTVKKFVKKLLQAGFLEKGLYDMKNKQYILHESLSRYYLFKLATFRKNFDVIKATSVKLYKIYQNKNIVICWYYSIICRDLLGDRYNEILFDKILNSSNQKLMLSTLQNYKPFVTEIRQLSLMREEAVLNAIGGDEYEAKKLYLEHFHISKDPKVLLELFEVKHKYYIEFNNELQRFSDINNPYISLGISYWAKHINMHYGKFDFYDYAYDSELIKDNIYVILHNEPYEGLHLLRRWYFDYYKVYFLSGVLDHKKIHSENPVMNILRQQLSIKLHEFDTYVQTYCLGDYLLYDVLFKIKLWNKFPKNEDIRSFGINIQSENRFDENIYVSRAEYYFQNTYKTMLKFSINNERHVALRLVDLYLYSAPETSIKYCLSIAEDYQRKALQIKAYEYAAYSHTILLKIKLINNILNLQEVFENKEIELHISEYYKYYAMHGENSNNQYSDLRIKLFEALYKFQCKHKQIALFKDDIVSLKEVCNKNNYRRELAIIEYLENKDQKIRPIDILKIYQCLFIIIQ